VAALDFLNRGSRTVVGTVLDKGLNHSSCISCGQCIQVCPTGALKEKSQVDQVGRLLQEKEKIIVALVDPTVYVTLGEFYGYKASREFSSILINALRRIGFQKVFGSAWGVEYQAGQLATRFIEDAGHEGENPLLLAECPSFVRYIIQSRPDLIPSLVPLKPAYQIMCQFLREMISKQTGRPVSDVSIVYLTSCIAAKNETAMALKMKAPDYMPDFSLTTREVFKLTRLFGIQVDSLSPESQEDFFGAGLKSGNLSAISGGFVEILTRILQARMPGILVSGEKSGKMRSSKDVRETTCKKDGFKLVLSAVSSISQFEWYQREIRSKNIKIDFIEVMACQHGCINGGGQPCRGSDRNLRNRIKAVLDCDEKYSGVQTRDRLELPADLALHEENSKANFVPRQIIK
jgi:iron only hydrogenase large subunit-like protein